MNESTLSADQNEFRRYVRNWLDENRPPAPPFRLPVSALEVTTEAQRDYLQEWQGRCYEAEASVQRACQNFD